MVPRVLQITENELCREHRNHIKKNHFHDHQENFCVLLCFQSFLVCAKHFFKIFFLTIKATFIQVAFKNIQGLLWKIQGLFKDIPQICNFQGLFKARANHEGLD